MSGNYTLDDWRKISDALPAMDDEAQGDLKNRILNIAAMLHADAHFEDRPKGGEKRAALERIERHARELHNALMLMDDDSRDAVMAVATEDDHDPQTEPPESLGLPLGRMRVRKAQDAVCNLLCWAKIAKMRLPPARSGAPSEDAKFRAAAALADVWFTATGRPPGRVNASMGKYEPEQGKFRAFANKALRPLSVKVSDDMAKRAIAEWKMRVPSPG